MTHTHYYLGYNIHINPEEDIAEYNPRDFDGNVGKMYCGHRRCNLGDHQLNEGNAQELLEKIEEHDVVVPLYLYEHGGMTMNTTGFSCPWDSGQVGVIVANFSQEFPDEESLTRALEQEIEVYDRWLRGEYYSYTVYDAQMNVVDSCSGFDSEEYCLSEAKALVDYQESSK